MKNFQFVLVVIAVAAAWGTLGYVFGMQNGTDRGLKMALSTNPVSEQLEITCAGLWVSQQNQKYWEKEKNGS